MVPAGGALTGWAALFVHGVDTADGVDPATMESMPIAVYAPRSLERRADASVRLRRGDPGSEGIVRIEGVAVVGPYRAAFDALRMAESFEAAVVVADAVTHAGVCHLARLVAYVDEHAGWTGVSQARRAVSLADPASRSPGESRLRVCYRLQARLPRPAVNVPVFSPAGGLLGIADLLDLRAGLVSDYDGALHRERRQHHADNLREERLESAGLIVVRVDGIDLAGGARRDLLVSRLRDGWQRGIRRDRTQDRWTCVEPEWWLALQDPDMALTDDERDEIYRTE